MNKMIENGNYCVYVHISPSGKKYVGQTKTKPEYRWGKDGNNYLQMKNGRYTQPAFAYAIQKYGWDNIEHEIIASNLTKEEADNFEKLLIEKLNTMNPKYGYNLREGGHNSHISEEQKKKISEALKGNIISDSTRKKISDSMRGKLLGENSPCAKKIVQYDTHGNLIKIWNSISDAARALNLSVGNIAKCCDETNNIYLTIGGYIWKFFGDELTKEYIDRCNKRRNSRHIVQYSLSNKLVYVYENITEAESKTGINRSNISACCNGRRKNAGGFIWRYYEDIKEEVI